jgi:4-hydroxy-3-methylbut-2-enyl diphosphate reductase
MRIIRASAMGLCFGVRDALETVATIQQPANVTIHGELVHNSHVLVQLQERGFQMCAEDERQHGASTSTVLVTAHGISDRERGRLLDAGKKLIDTTCPLVCRVHESAQRLAREGFHVLVIGRPGHVEVQGIIEDLASYDVVASVDDVTTWRYVRLGVICQTTTPPRLASEIVSAVKHRNPTAEVQFASTICQPTVERQLAVEELCRDVDAVVVVGGANSNNTRQLLKLVLDKGIAAWHVQSAADLRSEWFTHCDCVGLTAGTSTLDETVNEVYEALSILARSEDRDSIPSPRATY